MKKILILGTGPMAMEYAKVLNALGENFIVIGNSKESCKKFHENTSIEAIPNLLEQGELIRECNYAVNCVRADKLFETNSFLLENKVANILSEKPGALTFSELGALVKNIEYSKAKFFVGYNRRFYSSTNFIREAIISDGGVDSFLFEFTERVDLVLKKVSEKKLLENLFSLNSLHVVDLVFHLCGYPKEIAPLSAGYSDWHQKSMIFAGSGISQTGALFTYNANWLSAGRWGIEICTSKAKYFLRPLEEVHIMKKGSFKIEPIKIKNDLDIDFKPGLFDQMRSFLYNQEDERLIFLKDHETNFKRYYLKFFT